jgi:methylated-DNA-[protein]-cysteine S-methyltransferase
MKTTVMETPVGVLTLVATGRGLRAILWPDDDGRVPTIRDDDPPSTEADERAAEVLVQAERELTEYFAGERTEFSVRLDPRGTPFQLAAWRTLQTIPYGSTISYGEQARVMGDPRKARAVGGANGRNPLSIIVPCHRVVGANGSLTGFGGGMSAKAWLLDHEKRVIATSARSRDTAI